MLKEFIKNTNATMLCSGPMSKTCIDASIQIAKSYKIPQVLIASRRQIDDSEFGGGYVEGFTTQEFADYVRNQNCPEVLLARDHGGPWQSQYEVTQELSAEQAMNSAKRSFEADMDANFDYLHLDPSVPIQNENLSINTILERLFELYGHCDHYAKTHKKCIQFELGTEEQNGYAQDLDQFEFFLNETTKFCKKNNITKPTFVVAQTGTKVMEMENVGTFDTDLALTRKLSANHIMKTLKICAKYDLMLKEHNTDYLPDEALRMRPVMGIHASNVAPEFGVVETRGLLYLLSKFGYQYEYDLFVETALKSNKWEKWMLPDSRRSDVEKATICGHYIFNTPAIKEMRQKVFTHLQNKGVDANSFLLDLVSQSMLRYLRLFRAI